MAQCHECDGSGERDKMSDQYWRWSAKRIAQSIAQRELSVSEVIANIVEHIRHHNPSVNAIVHDLTDEALTSAAECDKWLKSNEPTGALFGVPATIKENVDQANKATPNGVVALRDLIAPATSPVVSNLERAGVLVLGRTNTPEFSFRAFTDNLLHGATLNPWDSTRTPGGSSGGAAVAALMGFGPIAHGNDIGGSLRIPAFACGLATVKPSAGRVPAFLPSATQERPFLASQMSAQGVIAREVSDVRMGLKAIIEPDPRDPWHIPLELSEGEPNQPIKIALTRDTYGFPVDDTVIAALDMAAQMLREAGYEVNEVETPSVRELAQKWCAMTFGEMQLMLDDTIRELGSAEFQRLFADYCALSDSIESGGYVHEMAERTRLAREWSLFLNDYPLMLSPFQLTETHSVDADLLGLDALTAVFNGLIYSTAFNYIGLPAGVIPAGYDSQDMPVGVQLVGRRFREDLILDALQAIEQRFGIVAERFWAEYQWN